MLLVIAISKSKKGTKAYQDEIEHHACNSSFFKNITFDNVFHDFTGHIFKYRLISLASIYLHFYKC